MNTHLLLFFIIISGVMTADQIGPNIESIMIKTEQETVTLSCSYDTSSSVVYLYWFRQYPNRELQYLIYKSARSAGGGGNPFDPRFSSSTTYTSTELTINTLTLSDSALYYCALRVLRIGVRFSATDALTFGTPISLTVVPKDGPNILPTLSILTPVGGKGSDICLAAGFFPKDKEMILNDDNNGLRTSNAALSLASKTYYYAGFNKESITKCKMDQLEATNTPDSQGKAEMSEKKSVPLDCPQIASNSSVSTNTGDPKMNSVTLLMTGLRILLAKCVAVNVLMSVKAFIV